MDPGLQPERTSLAWGRTMLAMVVASMLFLRWIPDYGWFPVILISLALVTAAGVYLGQRRRYTRREAENTAGGGEETRYGRAHDDAVAVVVTGAAVVVLGILGIYTILALPLL